eukprot:jgi/Tetstr1/455592/TSEL_042404.t1
MPMSAEPLGGKNALDKRIPKSGKYSKVTSVVKSGTSKRESTCGPRLENIRFRRDESVRRISIKYLEEALRTATLDVLLLDMRDEDVFEQMHIRGARNYPARMLSRSTNPFTPEILDQLNREEELKIIVIYNGDERKAMMSGNIFFEKGVDNVFVLSAGMKDVVTQIPWMMAGGSVRKSMPM